MITLTSLLFLSLCLCSPLGRVLDEVNTLVSWLLKSIGFWICLGRLQTDPVVRPVMGPRGVLLLPSFPSNTARGGTKALITNSKAQAKMPPQSLFTLLHSALQLCCSIGQRPKQRSIWMSLVPVRDCKVG